MQALQRVSRSLAAQRPLTAAIRATAAAAACSPQRRRLQTSSGSGSHVLGVPSSSLVLPAARAQLSTTAGPSTRMLTKDIRAMQGFIVDSQTNWAHKVQ